MTVSSSLPVWVGVCADGGLCLGHINNLYNTTFWTLIQQGGMDAKAAEAELAVSFCYFLIFEEFC